MIFENLAADDCGIADWSADYVVGAGCAVGVVSVVGDVGILTLGFAPAG